MSGNRNDTSAFAATPRPKAPKAGTRLTTAELVVDRGWAELANVEAEGLQFEVGHCSELELSSSTFRDVEFLDAKSTELDVADCVFQDCDLSGVRLKSVRRSTFTGCKFLGANFSTGRLADVVFDDCTLRFTNMRMADLSRVAFTNCSIDDLDLFDATIADIDFSKSRVSKLGVDRISASRVDLRFASELEFAQIIRLDGFLITDAQLPQLMHALAAAVGLGLSQD